VFNLNCGNKNMDNINYGVNALPSFEEIQRAAQVGRGVSKIVAGVTIIVGTYAVGYSLIYNGAKTIYKSVSEASEEFCIDDGSINSMICSGVSDYCEAYPDSIFC
jgi:hypothetical protein